MACTDCKQSIFDDGSSKIPAPVCVDNCPEDVNCNGVTLASACVYVNVALNCAETSVNQDLTTVLQALDAKACQNTTDSCLLKVDTDDQCCGTLNGKLAVGTGLTKTVTTDRNFCKTLTLNLDCPDWKPVTYNSSSKVRNNSWGYQNVEYSTVVGCKVKIRGVAKVTSYIYPNDYTTYVFQLPVNHRPLAKRLFGGFITQDGANYRPYSIVVDTDGKIYINISASGTYDKIPFEITFETN